MTVSFACDGCGQRYQVDASLAGKRMKCKKCERVLEIPAADAAVAAAPPIPPPIARPKPQPAPGYAFEPDPSPPYALGPEPEVADPTDYYAPPRAPVGAQEAFLGAGGHGFRGYAGFWRRFGALFIDSILLGAIGTAVNLVIGAALAAGGQDATSPGALSLQNLIGAVINITYNVAMISSASQATVGKMALGIKVTDLDGRRISTGRALGREFGKILSGCTLLIGYIMAGFTERKQALHDMIAGTLVVMK